MSRQDFRFLYISLGNLPSRAANSVTTAKTAQALARIMPGFELVTVGDLASLCLGRRFDFEGWYGWQSPVRVTRLPLKFRAKYPFPANFHHPHYPRAAAYYARLKRAEVVYTRSKEVVDRCLGLGLKVVFELHWPASHHDWSAYRNDPRRADNFIGLVLNSPRMVESHIEVGMPAEKILLAGMGVDLEQFEFTKGKKALRSELGLPYERPIAAYVGHLYDHRGIEDIFYAAARMPKTYFLLVGGWPTDVARRRLEAEQLGLKNVLITGHLANALLPRYLKAADVLLMPYSVNCYHIGWITPTKMYEYMAAQRPILSTDLPAINDFLSSGRNALLVAPDDGPALLDGLRRLLADPALGERLAEQAWQEVRSQTWLARAEKLADWILPRCQGKS